MLDYDSYKHIMDMEVSSDPKLSPSEKETLINISREGVDIYTAHRTGIKWCRQQIKNNNAEVKSFHTVGDKLVGIEIKVNYNLISLKSVPRKQKHISNIFSI